MDEKKLFKTLYLIASKAYLEGREHQFEADFPDVGMSFKKKFEDTVIYKLLKKGRKNYERN
jgi:hypothetical protein